MPDQKPETLPSITQTRLSDGHPYPPTLQHASDWQRLS